MYKSNGKLDGYSLQSKLFDEDMNGPLMFCKSPDLVVRADPETEAGPEFG